MKLTILGCHMASHVALVMSSVASGECVVMLTKLERRDNYVHILMKTMRKWNSVIT